jgi:hypothetical protein
MSSQRVPPAHKATRAAIMLAGLLLFAVPAVAFVLSDLPARVWDAYASIVENVQRWW